MSKDLQLGRGGESPEPGGEGRRRMPVNSIAEQPERVGDVHLVAGGGDTVLIDGFSPVGSYRLEIYLGELTYLGEPRRTAVTASESQRC